jgi:hypothetical protein
MQPSVVVLLTILILRVDDQHRNTLHNRLPEFVIAMLSVIVSWSILLSVVMLGVVVLRVMSSSI